MNMPPDGMCLGAFSCLYISFYDSSGYLSCTQKTNETTPANILSPPWKNFSCELFSWKKIFSFMKKNISCHVN